MTIHSAHGQSPFKVMYGWEPSLPIDHTISSFHDCKFYAVTEQIKAHHDFLESVQNKLEANKRLMV